MGRPYAVKGKKKRKLAQDAASLAPPVTDEAEDVPSAVKGKKQRKLEDGAASRAPEVADEAEEFPPPEEEGKEEEEDVTVGEGAAAAEADGVGEGIPIMPRPVDRRRQPGVIFVLERACLEVGKVGKVC
jgi:rRNA small subunit pseudouridine methyltransferase Nep1